MEEIERAVQSDCPSNDESKSFYKEIIVPTINKRELGKIQIKFVGNEGVETEETVTIRRKLIQTCIDFLQQKPESVWKNAEISIYDPGFNAIIVRSGSARYSFVCGLDDSGKPKVTDVSRRHCSIL